MRKLPLIFTFIVAGPAALCALSSQASAQTSCTLTKSETQFQGDRESCKKTCTETYQKEKKPQMIPGCYTGCDNTFNTCVQRKKDAEAKQKDLETKRSLCRRPYTDCLLKCPQGNNAQNKKCEEACNTGKVFKDFEACTNSLPR